MPLKSLRDFPRGGVPELRNAYRYLRGAHESVSGLLDLAQSLSDSRRAANGTAMGRHSEQEVDVLRSAIVFSSSGLDASMKRLVNDAARYLIPEDTAARKQYEQFMRQQLAADSVDTLLKDAVVAHKAEDALLAYYLTVRTKSSFQGSSDLKNRVCSVLGIPDKRVPESALKVLDPFFIARNNIIHSMDYEDVANSGGRARHHRSIADATRRCDLAFDVAADLMHAAAQVIVEAR